MNNSMSTSLSRPYPSDGGIGSNTDCRRLEREVFVVASRSDEYVNLGITPSIDYTIVVVYIFEMAGNVLRFGLRVPIGNDLECARCLVIGQFGLQEFWMLLVPEAHDGVVLSVRGVIFDNPRERNVGTLPGSRVTGVQIVPPLSRVSPVSA